MKRGGVLLAILGGLLVLLLVIIFVKVGWVLVGETNVSAHLLVTTLLRRNHKA